MARRVRPTKLQREAAYESPCPYCGASAGEPCHRPRGDKNRPHTARIPKALPPRIEEDR